MGALYRSIQRKRGSATAGASALRPAGTSDLRILGTASARFRSTVFDANEVLRTIEPSLRRFYSATTLSGRHLIVSGYDSGTGMDESTASQVFKQFLTTKKTGRGLGLSIAYSSLNARGGKMEFDSTPGCGSTFRIFVPSRWKKRFCLAVLKRSCSSRTIVASEL
jgi:hypothetical protein